MDPLNPRILYAAMWEAYRNPWSMSSGGPGSGLYRSNDGGNSWKHLEGKGLPAGILGRIGVSVSGADSNRVYALIESKESGLYRSDDGGDTWSRVNDDQRLTQRAWYFTQVSPDGSVAYREELLQLARKLGIAGRTIFTGFRRDIPEMLQLLDVVVHASVSPEPFGRVIAEGMAMRKPVVAAAERHRELIADF